MRRAIFSILLMLMPVYASTCEAEELGHHWACHSYWAEIHYQFVVMLCVIAAVAIREVIVQFKRRSRI